MSPMLRGVLLGCLLLVVAGVASALCSCSRCILMTLEEQEAKAFREGADRASEEWRNFRSDKFLKRHVTTPKLLDFGLRFVLEAPPARPRAGRGRPAQRADVR